LKFFFLAKKNLAMQQNDMERKLEGKWSEIYFQLFLDAFVSLGFLDDGGLAFGRYGLGQYEGKVTAAVVWCYPPADKEDRTGLSKIIVRKNVGAVKSSCGSEARTKQNCFYFDSQETFQLALEGAKAYWSMSIKQA
jgi:hypothetical protein